MITRFLGGSGGLSQWVNNGITKVAIRVIAIGVVNLLTKPPDPPSTHPQLKMEEPEKGLSRRFKFHVCFRGVQHKTHTAS